MTSQLQIGRAARIVRAGGIVAYPTEAVFGLGCLPDEIRAVRRILDIKRREASKGLLLIAADWRQVETWAVVPEQPMLGEIQASWPGPTTWILEARRGVDRLLTGGRATIGVRLTAHDVARRLCAAVGSALVSTSANWSGHPPLRRIWQVRKAFAEHVDFVVGGPLGGRDSPSMIRDGRDGTILRN